MIKIKTLCPIVKFGYNTRLIIVCHWFKSSWDNLMTVGLMEHDIRLRTERYGFESCTVN